jgi:hypothetical protein
MGYGTFSPTALTATEGLLYVDGSFMTNGTAQPVGNISLSALSVAGGNTFRGEHWATAVRQSTGNYLVTLDPYMCFRYVVAKGVDLDDTALDGAYATIGSVLNEGGTVGAPGSLPISFVVTTRAASGTLTDYGATTGTAPSRRLSFQLVIKMSGVGK